MELNNLLTKIAHPQEEEPKKFLAAVITDDIIQTAVWQVRNQKTEIVKTGSLEPYSVSSTNEEILEKFDKSLSSATLGYDEEINEVIYGLPNDWVRDNIIPEKLDLIKRITTELDIKALGYVTISDSIMKYLKLREGAPTSAIFIHIEDTQLTTSIVKLGQTQGSHTVGRTDDVGQDTEEALTRTSSDEQLPSRMIVYGNNRDMQEVIQNLNSYDFKSKFDFLHLPKIEALPSDAIISSVAIAGGAEVAKSLGISISQEKEKITTPEDTSSPSTIPPQLEKEPAPSFSVKENNDDLAKDFGFFKDQDVNQMTAVQEESKQDEAKLREVSSTKPKSPFSGFKIPSLKLKKPTLPKLKYKFLIPVLLILVTLSVLGYFFLYQLPSSTVTVYIQPKTLEEEISLTISPNTSSVNVDSATIPAELITTTVSGSESIETTGTKTIGDPASGVVTIFNRTSLSKTFEAGTIIYLEDKNYSLSDEVTIDASTEGADYTLIPGKADVSVTAQNIGEEYNLDPNQEFLVDSFAESSFVARNSDPITGGTSSQVSVVSEDDLDTLLDSLTEKLESEAIDTLSSNDQEDTNLYIQDNLTEVISRDYSAELSDEATNLSLDLELEVSGLLYNKSDIEKLVEGRISDAIPSGYKKSSLPIEVETSQEKALDSGDISLSAVVKISLIPDVNLDNLKSSIKGTSRSGFQPRLEAIPGFLKAEVLITPQWFPARLKVMPRNESKIDIVFKLDK